MARTAGLEVLKRGGAWAAVDVPVGAADHPLVVNGGDLTEVWTNGRWRSAPHRVVPVVGANGASRDRSSAAFFTGPDRDAVVAPIVRPGDAPRFAPTTAGAHLDAKLAATNTLSS